MTLVFLIKSKVKFKNARVLCGHLREMEPGNEWTSLPAQLITGLIWTSSFSDVGQVITQCVMPHSSKVFQNGRKGSPG